MVKIQLWRAKEGEQKEAFFTENHQTGTQEKSPGTDDQDRVLGILEIFRSNCCAWTLFIAFSKVKKDKDGPAG